MKKSIFAVLVAGLLLSVGCETSKNQQTTKTDEPVEASQPAAEAEEADQAQAEAEQKEDHDDHDDHDHAQAGPVEDLAPGKSGEYGAKFTVEGEPITLAAAMEQAAAEEGSPVKVSGAIDKVCKKKGCWFTLSGEGVEEPVRVKMKDYSFFVPRNSAGGQVVVEGVLEKRVVPQEEAQHYADDEVAGTDKEAEQIEGDQVQWEMIITAAKVSLEG